MKLNNKGLTLIELLISIVLVGIVLAFLFQILMDLKNETDNNDFAFNNQVNRLEAVNAVERDLIEYNLIGIEDVSTTSDIRVNFYFQKGVGTKTATLFTSVTPGTILSDDKYYLKYTSVDEINYTWLMKGAAIDPCGTFTYRVNPATNNYYFHLNLYLYNSVYNARNNEYFNNTVDDIEISYAGYQMNFHNVNSLEYKMTQLRNNPNYRIVDYIESSGTQYINTNYYPKASTKIELEAMITDTRTNNIWTEITGERNTYHSSTAIQIAFNPSSNYLAIDYGTNSVNGTTIARNTKFTVMVANNNNLINGTLATQNGTFSGTASYPLWIFDNNDAGRTEQKFIGRIYSYKIYENNSLVRYFVPIKRTSDNVVGLYDVINDVLYTNAGTGSFIAGNEIINNESTLLTNGVSGEKPIGNCTN